MHLLDTDALTHLLAGHEAMVRRLAASEDAAVGTTIVTRIELLRGRFDFLLKAPSGPEVLRAQDWLARTERLLADVVVVSHSTRQRPRTSIGSAAARAWARSGGPTS